MSHDELWCAIGGCVFGSVVGAFLMAMAVLMVPGAC